MFSPDDWGGGGGVIKVICIMYPSLSISGQRLILNELWSIISLNLSSGV